MKTNNLFILSIFALLTGCFSTVRSTQTISQSAVAKLQSFDYTKWTKLLKEHVDQSGRVDYGNLKANRAGLDSFVALLGAVGPTTKPGLFPTREDKLAYYINAYNALTMFNVINRLPKLKSVIDDKNSFFYFTEFLLDGQKISLYNLENKLIRPTFNEPRIHFALNCASVGCPQLPAVPFLPKTLEKQLAAETTKFLHEKRNVSVENGQIVISHIFKWYKVDFPPSAPAWIQSQAKDIKLPAGAAVTYRPYDWALNAQKAK